jgi:phosphoribosyl 1,2-cyclic phosphodiesterase/ActR/RegA family two-component response regulator
MDQQRYRFYIVDDDEIFVRLLTRFLQPLSDEIHTSTSSRAALEDIPRKKPDCVLLDMMMPGLDGLELLKRLRALPGLKGMKIVMVTGKSYEFDRQRALSFGADGYVNKPIDSESFTRQILRILEDDMELTFWGVRGTLPVPGAQAVRYGGNTPCVSIGFPRGNLFIFDAGTGIKSLSDHLLDIKAPVLNAKIFISHPHWDHINALPFFAPLYVQGNYVEILGPSHGDISVRDMISGQMDGVYFPIRIKEFSAHVDFRDLNEESFEIDDIMVTTMLLNHPGHCLGYRVTYGGRSVCYATDNELYPSDSPQYNAYYVEQLAGFIGGADFLITDSTYRAEEYEAKVGWGHSSVQPVVDLAHAAGVKTLCLFHHDPSQDDDAIDKKLEEAVSYLEQIESPVNCIAPSEKQIFKI